jgi:hypothetical protein
MKMILDVKNGEIEQRTGVETKRTANREFASQKRSQRQRIRIGKAKRRRRFELEEIYGPVESD